MAKMIQFASVCQQQSHSTFYILLRWPQHPYMPGYTLLDVSIPVSFLYVCVLRNPPIKEGLVPRLPHSSLIPRTGMGMRMVQRLDGCPLLLSLLPVIRVDIRIQVESVLEP